MRFFIGILGGLRETYANRHEPERLHVLAYIYWYIVLSITALVILASLSYGLWQISSALTVSSQGDISALPKNGVSTLKQNTLESTIDGFRERQAHFDFLKSNPPRLSDPSR